MLTKNALFRDIRQRFPDFSESDVAMMITAPRVDNELVTGTVQGYLTLVPGADIPRDYWIIRGILYVRAPTEQELAAVMPKGEVCFSYHINPGEANLCLRGLARFTDVTTGAVRFSEQLGVIRWFVTVPEGTDIQAAKQCLEEHRGEVYG